VPRYHGDGSRAFIITKKLTMMNSFTNLRNRVKKALNKYRTLREDLKVEDKMLSETIMREAQPFIKGHFTLAVVGEMSAGKSTFINALLGQRGLLPTAYGQTTCVLTEIVDSNEESVIVTFADGKEKKTDTQSLKQLVSIPKEFEDLPINMINRYIVEGYSYERILKKKPELLELQKMEIDDNLLKQYFNSHNSSNIPVHVVVKCPLPEAYQGWRIVDTPGVGAIGGIEQATKDFINGKDEAGYNNVDAIIFVNSGLSQMQRKDFNKFVEDTFETIYDEARKRTFLIITFGADPKFIYNKGEELKRAEKLFIEKYNLDRERLVCVDSICSLFYDFVAKTMSDISRLKKKEIPAGWEARDWAAAIDIRNDLQSILAEDEMDINNQNLLKLLNEYSGFVDLRKKLNIFAEEEKERVYKSLREHIIQDLKSFETQLKKNKNLCEVKLKRTKDEFNKRVDEEREALNKYKQEKNNILQIIRKNYSDKTISDRFNEVEIELLALRKEVNIYIIKNKAECLLSKVEGQKEQLYRQLSKEFSKSFDDLQNKFDVAIPVIDYDSIIRQTERESTISGIIGYKQKPTEGFFGGVKRFFGTIFSNDSWGFEKDLSQPIYGEPTVDKTKQNRLFADRTIEAFREGMKNFKESIRQCVERIGTEVSDQIDIKIRNQEDVINRIKTANNTSQVEEELKSEKDRLRKIKKTIKKIEDND
jgi:hypothetical protein